MMVARGSSVVSFPGKPAPKPASTSFAKAFAPHQLLRVRRTFRAHWAAMLRHNFNSDAVLIAFTFGVTERTAHNWMNEVCEPNGFSMAVADAVFPGTARILLEAA